MMNMILAGVVCSFCAGMIFAIPMGLAIDLKYSPLWTASFVLIFCAGVFTCAWLFFAPR
jgi:hypothetical protein